MHINVGLRTLGRFGAALALSVALGQPAAASDEIWADLKDELYGDREIHDGADWVALEAPYRAQDAAIVPITISALQAQSEESYIKTITLVIDENPAPVAAVINFEKQSGLATISTRVRVNAYTHVRAIAETNSGELFMATKFVKASGGCSAPAGKDHEEAMANLGKMRFRQFSTPKTESTLTSGLSEAQLMIRHPNYSGLQMDQITRHYTPAHFVREVEVRLGQDLLFSVEGAISLSENPSFRFYYPAQSAKELSATIIDTEEHVFSKSWALKGTESTGS